MIDGKQAITRLQVAFPEAVVSVGEFRDQHWATVESTQLVEICRWLRDDSSNAYDYLVDVTAVHWPDENEPIEMVYHLYSFSNNDRLRLKVRVGDGEAVPSVCSVWKAADWNERETYDMFGIKFEGHPDLRRILMPDDYTDFPLRKEFPLYRG